MKTFYFLLIALILLFNCSKDVEVPTAEMPPPLTDVLTFELSFGDENTIVKDEFLLASPNDIAVNDQNDILVLDENYVKVYDSSGKEKTKFGGIGQGPGEFERVRDIWISPNGYLTVFGDRFGFTAHYFRPDYSFIERVNYRIIRPYLGVMDANNLNPSRPEIVFNLGESERVYSIDSGDKDRNKRDHQEVFLFYETADTLITLANYTQTNNISGPGVGSSMSNLGRLIVNLLPGNRVLFLHTYHDSRIDENEATYTITIQSLDNLEKSFITHRYTPVEIEWKPTEYPEDFKEEDPEMYKRMKELDKITEKFLAERKYQSPLSLILTDNHYIFAVTHSTNDNKETLVDVFDGDTGKFIRSAYFPISYTTVIKNGYVYKISNYRQTNEFPVVEKYRIDLAVYGK